MECGSLIFIRRQRGDQQPRVACRPGLPCSNMTSLTYKIHKQARRQHRLGISRCHCRSKGPGKAAPRGGFSKRCTHISSLRRCSSTASLMRCCIRRRSASSCQTRGSRNECFAGFSCTLFGKQHCWLKVALKSRQDQQIIGLMQRAGSVRGVLCLLGSKGGALCLLLALLDDHLARQRPLIIALCALCRRCSHLGRDERGTRV